MYSYYRDMEQWLYLRGDIYDAYLRAAYIEELAQLYYNALCAGQGEEPYFFPPEELQKWEYPSQIKFPNK